MAKLKLNADLTSRIAHLISEGNYVEVACQAVGIGKSTFYSWLKHAETDEKPRKIYVDFMDTIKKAEAQSESKYLGVIRDAANGGTWQASAWWLERRYPEKWGRREKVDLTSGGKRLTIVIEHTDDAETSGIASETDGDIPESSQAENTG